MYTWETVESSLGGAIQQDGEGDVLKSRNSGELY